MPDAMTVRSSSVPKPKKPPRKPVEEPKGTRSKSRLTLIGEEAMRRALLESLVNHAWVLQRVAEDMGLTNAANVSRAIKQLGLFEQYKAARIQKIQKSD